MSRRHMLTYHVFVPLLVFAALLAFGAPVGTALGIGMMTGCVSMTFMMLGGGRNGDRKGDASDLHAGRQ